MMIKKITAASLLVAAAVTMPFLSWLRYAPLPDWVSDVSCVLLLAISMLFSLPARDDTSLSISTVLLPILGFDIYLVMSGHNLANATVLIAVLAFIFLWGLLFSIRLRAGDREDFLLILASVIFIFSMLQVVLGLLQVLGLAPLLHGYVVFDPVGANSNIIGNIGQRNQYAQFLSWGILAACYLYAKRRLRKPFFIGSVFFLAWLSACAGARLVWAYALIFAVLGWCWSRQNKAETVCRMSWAVMVAVVLMVLTQLFSQQIAALLSWLGIPIHVVSGADRFFSAGFGIRRRIEWTKAWEIFQQYPWFGVGWGMFPAQSVEMELTGGLPKYPESWLFVHCHNLFFQLLAETGIIGVLIVFTTLFYALGAYFRKGEQSAENLLLLGIGGVILAHSMFEYPLWYLPFLGMFLIVLLLAPVGRVMLPMRAAFVRIVGLVAMLLALFYIGTGIATFRTMVEYVFPTPNVQENVRRMGALFDVGKNPLWTNDVDIVLANYLIPSREQLDLKLQHFSRLAAYRPYPEVLLKLAVLYALDKQMTKAEHTIKLAIANYPDYAPNFDYRLAMMKKEELKPLQLITSKAAKAYVDHGVQTDPGRIAAVMTVASPVTRKPLF
ncbi:PglL family O-oligosaccharyltransferase [Aquitalea aquatica]|uniref:O-antigen ligase C-terminal domain-containing protein n=1 Tax=Aquitalea aquatica TaxID=3044273 RepID=A0A838YBM5_9NEIS|nr:Wzy polymerase domain-containing protein [Aquitalea magnusonii]MBA4709939.1 O-antigen ligase C-terminal domain-containing protein [Aquitalea magnusonii]